LAKTALIPPLEKLTKKQTASVLFVLPYQKNPEATSLRASKQEREFWSVVSNTLKSYAAITLKPRAGKWAGSDIEAEVTENAWRITEAVAHYEADCVVLLGTGFAKALIPDLRKQKHELKGTFHELQLPRCEHLHHRKILAMVYGFPEHVTGDPLEFVRMGEMMAKLDMVRYGFHEKPNITNLITYRSAREYIDFLANEHTGFIGFDTETYSLNRVNHQRLGSMQFAHNEDDAFVLLWDSKHQHMSPRDIERLRDPLTKLFRADHSKFDAWIAHNGMFDNMQVQGEFGVSMGGDFLDTMYFTHLMDENRKHTARVHDDYPFALKTLVDEFFGFKWYSHEAKKARSDGTLMDLPEQDFVDYAGYDPSVTFRLYRVLERWAKFEKYDVQVLNLLRKLHGRAVRLYSDISRNGFHIDRDRLFELLRKDSVINKRIAEINELYKTFPQIRAVNSELACADTGISESSFLKMPWFFDMNKQAHRLALFFDSKSGFQYPPDRETEKKSVNKKFQKAYSDTNKVVALQAEASGLAKLRNAYIKPLFEELFGNPDPHADTCDGRVHPWFHLTRTVTGRVAASNPNCFVSGTQVSVPCDRKNNKNQTKAIDKLKVGDYVYCLNNDQELEVRPVVNVWNQGKQDVIRIHFKAGNGRSKTFFDVTPEHKIRTLGFKWKRAEKLRVGDRVMAMSLSDSGHYNLTHRASETQHSAIARSVFGVEPSVDLQVHHKDGNHSNNNVDNLEMLTPEAHGEAHRLLSERSHNSTISWKNMSRYSALRILSRCRGRVARCRTFNYDFVSFDSTLKRHGIVASDVVKRYNINGAYLTKSVVADAIRDTDCETASRELGIGSRMLKKLCSFYGLRYGVQSKKAYQDDLPVALQHISQWSKSDRRKYARDRNYGKNNHVVTKIEIIKSAKTVWDIEVEEFHNFFASEVNVSNCQQVPRSDSPSKKAIKSLFNPAPGKVLLQADLSAAEVRVWGALSNDKRICELSVEAFELRRKVRENPDDLALREEAELKADFHKQTYGLCFNKSPKDVTKSERQDAKKLSFGLIYGMGDNSIAREIGKELSVALDIKKRFFGVYREGTQWLVDMQKFAIQNGYVETPLGRRRRFPQVFSGDGGDLAQAKRYAVNAPVQATASDYAMLATILLNDEIKARGLTDDVKIVNCVHDSVVLEITATEECLRYVSKLVRKIFTKTVVKQLKQDFGFTLNAPVDIDIEVSQWNMRKCSCCGATQYHTDGKTCTKKHPVLDNDGKPKLDKDGKKMEKVCGSKEYELIALNGGWGYLTTLAENERSFAIAAKGFKPVVDSDKAKKAAPDKRASKDAARSRRRSFLNA
jgi:DNA polymerase I-like protein with 3'-5' exonuclease and polymerase domains/intein/homing endonuclease